MSSSEKFSINIEGYAMVDRTVRSGTSSGRLHVPKSWVGKKVRVLLLDPIEVEK